MSFDSSSSLLGRAPTGGDAFPLLPLPDGGEDGAGLFDGEDGGSIGPSGGLPVSIGDDSKVVDDVLDVEVEVEVFDFEEVEVGSLSLSATSVNARDGFPVSIFVFVTEEDLLDDGLDEDFT